MSLQPTSVSYRQAQRIYRDRGPGRGFPHLVRSGYDQAARANSASSRTNSSSFFAVNFVLLVLQVGAWPAAGGLNPASRNQYTPEGNYWCKRNIHHFQMQGNIGD